MRPIHPVFCLTMLLLLAICLTVPPAAAELPERCKQAPVNGPCKALIEKYHFDQQSRKCKPYFYDGCGEVVPFDTLEECRQLCEEGRPEPKNGGRQDCTMIRLRRTPVTPRYSARSMQR